MSWSWWYEAMYRRGMTPWDSGVTPPEVVELIEGSSATQPGRALDLGCGTGTNVAYLARHGWEATGVESSQTAIAAAAEKIEGLEGARVLRGDVTRLEDLDLEGPFDLILDIGCFHTVSTSSRDDYARGVGSVARSEATLFVFAFPRRLPWTLFRGGVTPREMRERFAPWFDPVGRIAGRQPPGAAWFRLRRR